MVFRNEKKTIKSKINEFSIRIRLKNFSIAFHAIIGIISIVDPWPFSWNSSVNGHLAGIALYQFYV